MANKMALTAIGRDCPGIVAAVSQVLFEHGCNIEDSSMTILRGEFAMILVVQTGPTTDLPSLQSTLHKVETDFRLLLSFRQLPDEPEEKPDHAGGVGFIVSVYGADKPGIVFRVTKALADCKANITDVTTRVVGQETLVYIMLLEVEVPLDQNPSSLERRLQTLAQELSIDITVRPLESAAL